MRYRINTRKVTFREIRTEASIIPAVIGWLVTRLPITLTSSSDIPAVDSLAPYRVSKEQVPADIMTALEVPRQQLAHLGFRGTIYHHVDDPVQQTTIWYATFLHESGTAIAKVRHRVFAGTSPPKTFVNVEIVSPLNSGEFLTSSNGKGDLQLADGCHDANYPEVSLEELWHTHRSRMSDGSVPGTVVRMGDGKAALATLEKQHEQVVRHFVDRGLFVPVDDSELPALAPDITAADASEGAPGEVAGGDALLLAAVRKIEDKPAGSRWGGILVLVASIAVFIAVGGLAWDWKFALLLVPILLIHEAGHYLAMKLFDYRNVQMFFIPLFGAAVTGRHYNVPGWKKVVTSLMGPVPGIGLGTALGIIAMVQGSDWLLELSTLMVVINGFNLLPTLPLDGGWVLHGLLFARHAFLDFLFRLLAIGLLMFSSLIGLGRFFLYIGIAMLVGLPAAFNVARISDRLRASGHVPPPTLDGKIPAEAIDVIGRELDEAYPKGLDVRNKAQLAVQVFENVNAKPPGIGASLLLGSIYASSFMIALVVALVFSLAQNSDFKQLMRELAFAPETPLAMEEVVSQPPNAPRDAWVSERCLIVDFAEREAAQRAYDQLRSELTPQDKLLLAGNTVFVPLDNPALDEKSDAWFDRFEPVARNVWVTSKNATNDVAIVCIAHDADTATQLADDINQSVHLLSEYRLIPPWHPTIDLTDEQRLARKTVMQLQQQDWIWQFEEEDEQVSLWQERMGKATERGRDDRAEQAAAKLRELFAAEQQKRLEQMQQAPPGTYDSQVVARYLQALEAMPDDPEDAEDELYGPQVYPPVVPLEDWLPEVAERLGQLPDDESLDSRTEVAYGYASSNGLFVNLTVSFEQPACGLLWLADWLTQQGCIDLKYGIAGGGLGFE